MITGTEFSNVGAIWKIVGDGPNGGYLCIVIVGTPDFGKDEPVFEIDPTGNDRICVEFDRTLVDKIVGVEPSETIEESVEPALELVMKPLPRPMPIEPKPIEPIIDPIEEPPIEPVVEPVKPKTKVFVWTRFVSNASK